MAERKRTKSTSTSNFGVSRRESHDSAGFYARFAPPTLSDDETVNPSTVEDEIICGDARAMEDVADNSVALVVTSPPYFAGKAYEEELGQGHIPASYLDYLQMLRDVFAECLRVLEPGGRIAVNVANLGRKPYRSLSADVISILQDELGYLLRGEVVWQKGAGASGSCAWGSFAKATNPVLRDVSERIILASKGRFDRAISPKKRQVQGLPHESTISSELFMALTLDVWQMPTESAKRVGHPAPYPVELPERLIQLYTYKDDVVLDPFMGSGSTAIAAARTDRRYIGYDLDPEYCELAEKRLANEPSRVVQDAGAVTDEPVVPTKVKAKAKASKAAAASKPARPGSAGRVTKAATPSTATRSTKGGAAAVKTGKSTTTSKAETSTSTTAAAPRGAAGKKKAPGAPEICERGGMKTFETLYQEIRSLADAPKEGSFTSEALAKGPHFIGKKLLEEAGESWMAAEYEGKERTAEEIAQLLYFAQVMMVACDIDLEAVYHHL
jgi:phosphoribosyl-ATP pyrophosphohydrolase